MRTSHLEIRKRIENEKLAITDEALFASTAFAAYLMDLAEAATRRYRRPLKVKVHWKPDPTSFFAYTDNRTIHINCANTMTQSFPTRQLRADSIIGLEAHELGHNLFSDFAMRRYYGEAISAGRFYPRKPQAKTPEDKEALSRWLTLAADEDDLGRKVVTKLALRFHNILEDAFIEAMICERFPGSFRTGIVLNRIRMMETSPSIQKEIEEGFSGYAIVHNLLLQYCTDGDFNNLEEYRGEYMDAIVACIPIVDDAIYAEQPKQRFGAANLVLIKLWKYVEEQLETARQIRAEHPELSSDEIADAVMGELGKELDTTSGDTVGGGRPARSKPDDAEDPDSAHGAGRARPDDSEMEELKEMLRSALDCLRGLPEKTDSISEGGDGGVERDLSYSGSGYPDAAKDIEKLLTTMAEDRVNTELEQELTEELQAESERIRYGNAHAGTHVVINRMSVVDERLVEQYNRVAPPLLNISKQMQRELAKALLERPDGGKRSGLYMGKRLETRSLHREDCRVFFDRKDPSDDIPLAVALLLDESGSMGGARISTARAASIAIYDFCQSMGLPILVYGHTEDFYGRQDVQLYAYAEFDCYDNMDRYRLMDIDARENNRDGAALRYVAERLLTRPEPQKLLILVSDGEPAASGYSGTEAEADLRGIKLEYANRGITVLCAAIGDDKPNIRRIYGDESFLDITDLDRLPANLVRQLVQRLRIA